MHVSLGLEHEAHYMRSILLAVIEHEAHYMRSIYSSMHVLILFHACPRAQTGKEFCSMIFCIPLFIL